MSVIYDNQDRMIVWAVDKIGGHEFRPDAKAIGIERGSELVAVVVFDNFSPGSCCISVASDGTRRWLTREFLIRVFAYPFIQLGHHRLTALISATNHDSQRFCTSCGFQKEGLLRQGCPDQSDMIVMGLLRDECRWLPERFSGKIGRPAL
ncbi:GNAT family protein [Rhizobium sp. 18065]|uniref:GNAT family N-acetyltransferase n=1 Tax=Rhizobium sp. 18065 TaxID=2681411 RepID=UPI001359A209|nr:GNAT family protein [Rhizobium sp. 18065]